MVQGTSERMEWLIFMAIHRPISGEIERAWEGAYDPKSGLYFAHFINNARLQLNAHIGYAPGSHNGLLQMAILKPERDKTTELIQLIQEDVEGTFDLSPMIFPALLNSRIDFEAGDIQEELVRKVNTLNLKKAKWSRSPILPLDEDGKFRAGFEHRSSTALPIKVRNHESEGFENYDFYNAFLFDWWIWGYQENLQDVEFAKKVMRGLPKVLSFLGFKLEPRSTNSLKDDVKRMV